MSPVLLFKPEIPETLKSQQTSLRTLKLNSFQASVQFPFTSQRSQSPLQ